MNDKNYKENNKYEKKYPSTKIKTFIVSRAEFTGFNLIWDDYNNSSGYDLSISKIALATTDKEMFIAITYYQNDK